MTGKTVMVAAANDAYFEYLRELLYSLHDCGADREYDFAVLDVGLRADQSAWLSRYGVKAIVRPEWPFGGLERQPEWFKAIVCRPFLPSLLGGWDCIVCLDADSWFQTGEALEEAIGGARREGFAVVPLLDRAHWQNSAAAGTLEALKRHRESLALGFGEETAEQFHLHPPISGAFFAGRRDAPHWATWQQYLLSALGRSAYASIAQAALTLTIHRARLPAHLLPVRCHWHGHLGTIGFDTASRRYVEPFHPHAPISVLGLSAHSKTEPVLARTTDGRWLNRRLRHGRGDIACTVNVTIGESAHDFDGIASPRFREQAFERIGRRGAVRFLQIGAMDGISFDPIHAAVRRFGWSGTLVEPQPDMQARLQANYAGMAGLAFAPVAIAERSERRSMHRVRPEAIGKDKLPGWAEGIASLLPERNALGGKKVSPGQHAELAGQTEVIEVDCLSFADFASRYAIGGLDVLQIDAEGCDWLILGQIDLDRHAPACIHMEIACLPGEEIAESLARLRASGYVCYVMEDGENQLALRRDFCRDHFGIA